MGSSQFQIRSYNRSVEKLVAFWNRYERHLSVVTLVCGFTFDLIIAKRPDSIPDNILLLFYLVLGAFLIARLSRRSSLVMLLILQFCFGGLSSNLLILYGKSGSFGGTAIFLALLAAMLVGNELLKSRYDQLRFNIAVYYFLLLTYLVIALPTFVFHRIGTQILLVSDIASLLFIGLLLWVLFTFVLEPQRKKQALRVGAIVLCICAVFNGLYYLNVIPPVPLSLKAAGIYHSMDRNAAGDFIGTFEQKHWYEFWRDTADVYHIQAGQPAYCFTSVFAPGTLSAPIVHRWDYFYEPTGHWVPINEVQFSVTGGRDAGFRGYSTKRVLEDGKWRCTVATASGQVIGYVTFLVQTGSTTPPLSTTAL